ncbi:hypothetical protein [Paenibacillus cremeus]|uniref:Uncharacterized protein n=1 Tax=Paenibacillus cremeus TaxID=2163881 RepID=A0A559K002_9BACL|nr:hypothetical protein [Paenibacillus cremeus]TVY05426.1 hypothetical protein FPZ49_30360 [Paenibacillus cremeus]
MNGRANGLHKFQESNGAGRQTIRISDKLGYMKAILEIGLQREADAENDLTWSCSTRKEGRPVSAGAQDMLLWQ